MRNLILLLFLALTVMGWAEEEFNIFTSIAQFKNLTDNSKIDLEVYINIPLNSLKFTQNPDDNLYEASYLVKVWATSQEEDATYQNTDQDPRFVELHSLDEISPSTTAVEMVQMTIPPGKYEIQIGVVDINSKNIGVSDSPDTELKAYPEKELSFSDLELATGGDKVEQTSGKLIKNGYIIIPNATNAFMADKSNLAIYFEIYNLPVNLQEKNLPITIQFKDLSDQLVDAKTYEYVQSGDIGFFVGKLSLENLLPTKYNLSVIVGNTDKPLHTYKKEILVTKSGVTPTVSETNIPDSVAATIRDEIRLIATSKEMELWDKLGPSQRADFLKSFWMRRDTDQKNPRVDNEFRRTFYERLRIVDEKFSYLNVLGRDSDPGRVYLTYGEPNEITSSPMGISSMTGFDTSSWTTKGALAWSYDNKGPNNTQIWFIFVDNDGDGVFQLYSSNMKGWGKYTPN